MSPPRWESFDHAWLVELAEEQKPHRPEIAAALQECRACRKRSVAYWYFVDATNPNEPGSQWQFSCNVELISPEYGPLILDVLKDGRIGGVEFLDRIQDVP